MYTYRDHERAFPYPYHMTVCTYVLPAPSQKIQVEEFSLSIATDEGLFSLRIPKKVHKSLNRVDQGLKGYYAIIERYFSFIVHGTSLNYTLLCSISQASESERRKVSFLPLPPQLFWKDCSNL
jgi:hypothetical protein